MRGLEVAARFQHARRSAQRTVRLRHVHQAHERGYEIEGSRGERQVLPARHRVTDTRLRFLPARVAHDGGGDIHGAYGRTARRQQPRIVAFSVAQVEPPQPAHAREKFERGRVHQVAVQIPTLARKGRPHFGVFFPIAACFAAAVRQLTGRMLAVSERKYRIDSISMGG